jgi:hypothetical protein
MADYTLRIKKGEDWERVLTAQYTSGSLADLSLYSSFSMEIKSNPQDTNPVAVVSVSFSITASTITFNLTRAQTSSIPTWGKTADDVSFYVSDLFGLKTDGTRKKICTFDIEVEPEVTTI